MYKQVIRVDDNEYKIILSNVQGGLYEGGCLSIDHASEVTEIIGRDSNCTYEIASFREMFKGFTKIKTISFPDNCEGVFSDTVTFSMNNMFEGCTNLTSVDFSNLKLDHSNLYNNVNLTELFKDCTNLSTITPFNKEYSPRSINFRNMFYKCSSLQSTSIEQFIRSLTPYVPHGNIALTGMFYYCMFETIDMSIFEEMMSYTKHMDNQQYLTSIGEMFYHCSNLKEVDVSYLNEQYLEICISTFANCRSLEKIYSKTNGADTAWHTANNSVMMFWFCSKLPNYNEKYLSIESAFDSTETREVPGYFTIKE